ncbi:crossover junction endodeoxyribonuclease RuvC [Candidatus Gracilibacteria bacterium 28_42_T64]|nr:crossover junction endodeoxyribonuclease RuvC [Candidatus Gracilibacteria bacterium 28_42_T64]
MIILGIDPGTTTTGFALIKKESGNFTLLDYGIFKTTPKIDLAIKLLEIGNDIKEIISSFKPDVVVIEKLFFQTNLKTGIDVAQARGVVMYESIRADTKILEYTPLQVKKAITGNGQANKLQLQNAIKMIFKLDEIPKPDDAADAIGLAYMGALNNRLT